MSESEELKMIKAINKFWDDHTCEEFAESGDCRHKHPQEISDDAFMRSAERSIVIRPGEIVEIPRWDGPYLHPSNPD